MIKFSELPVNSGAADALTAQLVADVGRAWTQDEIRRMVDEGCAASVAILKAIDGPMQEALSRFSKEDQPVVFMIVLTMTMKTLDAAIEAHMLESFLRMMGINPGDQ